VPLASIGILRFTGAVNVFTYGSLMFDEVWRAVVGRLGASTPGRLDGFEAWRVAGQTFPGLTPAAGHRVAGRIWHDVTDAELARLDTFESGMYQRELLPVMADGGAALACWTYLVRPDSRGLLLAQPWDREEFRRVHLPAFLT